MMSLATLLFGTGGYCFNEKTFFAISFIGRMFQGIADGFILVSIPSIVSIEYPD